MILGLAEGAVQSGASLKRVCEQLGVASTTLQRWRNQGIGDDRRAGPATTPANKLTPAERARVVAVACSAEFRDLSPKQIVPTLADRGEYIASESTMYRVLREEQLNARRGRAKEPTRRSRPSEKVADGPGQLWSWDITYLRGPVRGSYFYLYTVIDVWSRKIVGSEVHECERVELAAALITRACKVEGVLRNQLVLHSDNGGPMKGATMLVTLQGLGVVPSFSRPRVSDDNPFSEALFRTMKYRPEFPTGRFDSLEAARAWVSRFTRWYNETHLHSGIGFVTPMARHARAHRDILARRRVVFEAARQRHPERWRGKLRALDPIDTVTMHPAALEAPATGAA